MWVVSVCAMPVVVGERERANLVVRSSGIFCLYIYIYIYAAVVVRHVSAHARLLTRFFLSEIISKFLHIFTHARYAPIDLASQPRTSIRRHALQPSVTD